MLCDDEMPRFPTPTAEIGRMNLDDLQVVEDRAVMSPRRLCCRCQSRHRVVFLHSELTRLALVGSEVPPSIILWHPCGV